MIYYEIKKHIPDFKMDYDVDPIRQSIADSWTDSIDSTSRKYELGFKTTYDLNKMTVDMIEKLSLKLNKNQKS